MNSKMKRFFGLFLGMSLILVQLTSCIQKKKTTLNQKKTISGQIINGFRILEINPKADSNNFMVYRGDYIKFKYAEAKGPLSFVASVLKYKKMVNPSPNKSPYFKMKAAGSYKFSLGSRKGVITVIELILPNYKEVKAKEAAKILKNLKPFLLDVRTAGEYRHFHIANAMLIPISQLQSRLGELKAQKNRRS